MHVKKSRGQVTSDLAVGLAEQTISGDGASRAAVTASKLLSLDAVKRGDDLGFSLTGVGDFNRDGFDDFLVAAKNSDKGGRNAGVSYLIFGSDDIRATVRDISLDHLKPSQGMIIVGGDKRGGAGSSVSGVGDFNGDGISDLYIGVPAGHGAENKSGTGYILFGGSHLPGVVKHGERVVDLSTLPPSRGIEVLGEHGLDGLGTATASLGDVNGDGFEDVIFGAPYSDDGGQDTGVAYVLFGGHFKGSVDLAHLEPNRGFVVSGAVIGDRLGRSVSSAGDFNGDGIADFALAAKRADVTGSDSGQAHIVFGSTDPYAQDSSGRSTLNLSDMDAWEGLVVNGARPADQLGRVSNIGDFNGDGFDDVVLGARYAANKKGEAYVLFGHAMANNADRTVDLRYLKSDEGFIVRGVEKSQAGVSVSGVGDFNGDGLGDFVVGAPFEGESRHRNGSAYIIWGDEDARGDSGDAAHVVNLGSLTRGTGVEFGGLTDRGYFAWSVSGAGDINGDGFDDLLVGAYKANNKGQVFVMFGRATSDSNKPLKLTGTADADYLIGSSKADVVNSVGSDDVVRTGAGGDNVSITSENFFDLDGGSGRQDKLIFRGTGVSLSAEDVSKKVSNFEIFDISGTGANELYLDAETVIGQDKFVTKKGDINPVFINGNANDTLYLVDSGSYEWSLAKKSNFSNYDCYRAMDGNKEVATVFANHHVTVDWDL